MQLVADSTSQERAPAWLLSVSSKYNPHYIPTLMEPRYVYYMIYVWVTYSIAQKGKVKWWISTGGKFQKVWYYQDKRDLYCTASRLDLRLYSCTSNTHVKITQPKMCQISTTLPYLSCTNSDTTTGTWQEVKEQHSPCTCRYQKMCNTTCSHFSTTIQHEYYLLHLFLNGTYTGGDGAWHSSVGISDQ